MGKLRWKMDEAPTGLARVCAGPRGHWLTDGEQRFIHISPHRRMTDAGWYWTASWDFPGPYRNTCGEKAQTLEEAKAAAMAYFKEHQPKDPT